MRQQGYIVITLILMQLRNWWIHKQMAIKFKTNKQTNSQTNQTKQTFTHLREYTYIFHVLVCKVVLEVWTTEPVTV